MKFDEFIELCENDLTLFEQFKEFILDEIQTTFAIGRK